MTEKPSPKRRARAFFLVPTYLVYLLVNRFYAGHVWYQTNCSYDVWCRHTSPLCFRCGVAMTIFGFHGIAEAIYLLTI